MKNFIDKTYRCYRDIKGRQFWCYYFCVLDDNCRGYFKIILIFVRNYRDATVI